MGIDKFPQELYKSYRNYLMKRYYAFFHVFFLMEITKTEKKSHVFAVAPHAGAWIEIILGIRLLVKSQSLPMRGRGLKFDVTSHGFIIDSSLPMRGRGLKYTV